MSLSTQLNTTKHIFYLFARTIYTSRTCRSILLPTRNSLSVIDKPYSDAVDWHRSSVLKFVDREPLVRNCEPRRHGDVATVRPPGQRLPDGFSERCEAPVIRPSLPAETPTPQLLPGCLYHSSNVMSFRLPDPIPDATVSDTVEITTRRHTNESISS